MRIGSPILAGASRLWDEQGAIEYSERCLPYRLTIGWPGGAASRSPGRSTLELRAAFPLSRRCRR
ncbi:hypothetical protein ACFQ0G_11775 [Streptomyces chiangmaiensis]